MNLMLLTTDAETASINPALIYALITTLIILTLAVLITDVRIAKGKNIHRIAKFEKIRFEIFKEDFKKNLESYFPNITDEKIQEIYDNIKLPKRGTAGAAGYDIFSPIDADLPFGESVVIPTGLRCRIDNGWDLELLPRSGGGFKYGIRLANTSGVIDCDYYSSSRDGHIMVKLVNNDEATNTSKKPFALETGKGFAQGLFRIYGITEDDDATEQRIDGFGSTDKKPEEKSK